MDISGGLRSHLRALLKGGQAFDRFEDLVAEVPEDRRFDIPDGAERSAWQIVEHMRLSMVDIVEFSDNAEGEYREKGWPEGYWPESASGDWDGSIEGYLEARQRLEILVEDPGRSLMADFPWGDGQTLLREAMLAAEHAAYHCGELVILTRWLKVH